jgi:hypothetical protein
MLNKYRSRRKKRQKNKTGHKRSGDRRRDGRGNRRADSSDSASSNDQAKRRKRKRNRKDTSTSSSSSSDSANSYSHHQSSSYSSGEGRELSPESARERAKRKKARADKKKFEALNEMWDIDLRPEFLRTIEGVADYSMAELIAMKKEYGVECDRRNLGEDIFLRDGKPKKIKFKVQTDDGKQKLHKVRFLRPPIAHPKEYYKSIPRKRETVIRNFPMDHLGVQGLVQDAVIGKLHNFTVLLTYDHFGKTSVKPGKGASGKYADRNQLEEGLLNFAALNFTIWPMDYTAFVIWRVLNEAKWGEVATADEKKRSDLVIDFFNAVLADNCARAVHDQYPTVYEQVQ